MTRTDFIEEVDPREAKLPRWAQERFAQARRRVREAEAEAREARLATKADQSLVIMERMASIPIGLGEDPVTFKPSLEADWTQYIQVRPLNGGIEVYANTGPLAITPVSTNVVRIKNGEW